MLFSRSVQTGTKCLTNQSEQCCTDLSKPDEVPKNLPQQTVLFTILESKTSSSVYIGTSRHEVQKKLTTTVKFAREKKCVPKEESTSKKGLVGQQHNKQVRDTSKARFLEINMVLATTFLPRSSAKRVYQRCLVGALNVCNNSTQTHRSLDTSTSTAQISLKPIGNVHNSFAWRHPTLSCPTDPKPCCTFQVSGALSNVKALSDHQKMHIRHFALGDARILLRPPSTHSI